MSVLAALDATHICARWSAPLADPAAWATLAPVPARTAPAAHQGRFSWWSLARNPHALLVTGMLGPLVVKDALRRVAASRGLA